MFDVSKRDMKFLEACGYGKQESIWISEYDSWAVRHGFMSPYQIVGREPQTTARCGTHRNYMRCGESALHGAIGGDDYWHNTVNSCSSYRCRMCWKYGWAVRRAHMIECRFLTAEKVLGLPVSSVEHLSVSAPNYVYDFSPRKMYEAFLSALRRHGCLGGCTILHPFRKDRKVRDLKISFHYHVLGYVEGGFDRCRECGKYEDFDGCLLSDGSYCDGFVGVSKKSYYSDGWVVSMAKNEAGVVEKRDSVFGSAWYQLEHSGYKTGVRRFRIVEWFGNVARRKFLTEKKRLVCNCAICKSEMKRSFLPSNVAPIPSNRGERGFLKNFTLPHVDGND